MPYPSKLTRESIIARAWEMIDQEGVDAFSMHQLAAAFGVKTPSLYRYVKRNDLYRSVNTLTSERLLEALYPTLEGDALPFEKMRQLALSYRSFAHAHPTVYGLMYTNTVDDLRPDEDELEQGVLPLQALMAQHTDDDNSLPALRGLMALIHGYLMLEIAGQYRRGGDLDETFIQVIEAYLHGWSS